MGPAHRPAGVLCKGPETNCMSDDGFATSRSMQALADMRLNGERVHMVDDVVRLY